MTSNAANRARLRVLVTTVAAVAGLAGCARQPVAGEVSPTTTVTATPAPTPSADLERRKFAFGIEYVFPIDGPTNGHGIARHYSEIGATWSKFNGLGTLWGDIEPRPPKKGVHRYEWNKLDEAIGAMQEAGFLNLTVVVGPRGHWGCRPQGGFFRDRRSIGW